MTDIYMQRMAQASWRGVVFGVRSEELPTGGRKTALHDFPNSNERFVEDLGEIPERFTVRAFVHGSDWIERAQNLERALREPGPGRLVLPTFGAFTMWALPFRKSASQTSIGEIEFELEFAASRALAGIIESAPTSELVFAAGDNARSVIGDALSRLFGVPIDSASINAALYDISATADAALSAVSRLVNANSLTDLLDAVGSISALSGSLIGDPIALAKKFFDIDDSAPGLWQIISEGLDIAASVGSMLNFARTFGNNLALIRSDLDSGTTIAPVADISLWPATTADRIARNQNRKAMVESSRLGALAAAYEQAANADYQTTEQVTEVRTQLEDVFADMMRVDAQDVNSVPADPAVREAMDDLRIAALQVLDQKAQSAWMIAQIQQNQTLSAPLLAYQLYAESITSPEVLDDRSNQVRLLNPDRSAIKLSGQLNVLSGRNA